ncbi:MAG: NAD+ synthase [Deltaproteobacteria bacterium]|nr:NAD+ synthase [Deltaproteobacteria bacterium]
MSAPSRAGAWKIAIAQLNPTVGDLAGNRRLIEEFALRAAQAGAGLVVFPELALTGYPPMDLLEREGFVRDQLRALEALAGVSRRIPLALGAALPVKDAPPQRAALHNAAVLLADGARRAVQPKSLLPTYDVFDEKRYFAAASHRKLVELNGLQIGLSVCEDAWACELGYRGHADPVAELAAAGADLILNLSASPWHAGRSAERRRIFCELAARCRVPVIFANQVGGNDELIFDGASFAVDAAGRLRASLPLFEPALEIADLESAPALQPGVCDPEPEAQLESALVLGIRDYFHKQGLRPGAVVGLSGGIDSAVTAWLAVRALGPEGVLGVAMPGPFSSQHSLRDAHALGRGLGIEVREADIRPLYREYRALFAGLFGAREDYGIAQQNIQSRIRGAILMAVSNAEGRLVLATGNKSELSLGYCTLYGDTVGGLAVLGDVFKRDVYALARRANRAGECIPESTIAKPPSAELAPGQLDTDDLPPYELLDAVLEQAIERGRGAAGIAEALAREPGPAATPEAIAGIVRRLDQSEYKRRQAPLVLRVSPKAFGAGRRLPIVHRYAL